MADTDRPFATQYILPMAGIRTGGTANRPAITTRGSLGLFPDDTRTAMPPLPQIGSGAYSRLAATQQPAPYIDAIMRRTRGMGALPAGGGLPTPPPAPKSPSLMDRLTPAMGTPAQAGLASAAATGLQLSGYRPVPITTAEGLGAMMQAGMKSYQEAKAAEAAAKRADLADRIAIAELGLKAPSGGLAGKSVFAQVGNTLLDLAPKIKAGTATAKEKALYAYAYGSASKPTTQRTYDEEGNETITEIPAQDLPEDTFPRPEGFRPPMETTKPSAKGLKDAAKIKESAKMLANLNALRMTYQDPEFTVVSQAGGALGFPTKLAARAGSQAQALRLDLKTLYELGALVGGDFQILDALLVDPNTAGAIKGGRDLLNEQLDLLERQLELDMAEKGVELRGTQSMPIIADTKADYDAAPNYTFVKLPDGRTVYKNPRGNK